MNSSANPIPQFPTDPEASPEASPDQPLPDALKKAAWQYLMVMGENPLTEAHLRALEGGAYVLAKRLMFHWTVIHGYIGDLWGYDDRWCFATEASALEAVAAWPMDDPKGYEPSGWHRHPATGRRREGGDPARETVSH